MAINILCAAGFHSWSGRVCCKCGKKRGDRRLPQVNDGESKEVYFPVDLYNQGVRLFNSGDKLGAKDVFLNVCNHTSVEPSFRFFVAGGIAVASQSKKRGCKLSQQGEAGIPIAFAANPQEAVAAFIIVNLVRSLDPTVEAMSIRMNSAKNKLESDFRFRGRNYGCSIIFANGEFCGDVWSCEKGVTEVLTEPKKHFPRCHGDEVVKKNYSDWLALKPKIPLLPINFVLTIDGYTSKESSLN